MNVILNFSAENTNYLKMAYFNVYYRWKPKKLEQDFKFAFAYAD